MAVRHSAAPRTPDRIIAALAARQHGVVTRRQLLDAGIGPDAVDRRMKAGRLRAVHRAVYLVGPVMAPRAPEMAAVLACGGLAVVSHLSGAVLWNLLVLVPASIGRAAGVGLRVVHVIMRNHNRRRPGIRIHVRPDLHVAEVTRQDGIPLTTPDRTLLDLASVVGTRELERAMSEAFARRLATPAGLRRVLTRHPGDRGAGRLRRLLAGDAPVLTRSEAEERFLAIIREAQLEAPEANVRIEGIEVDFLWKRERLVVEVDGHACHGSRHAFEKDRERDAVLAGAGLRVIRVTWRQLVHQPLAVVGRVARALGAGPG